MNNNNNQHTIECNRQINTQNHVERISGANCVSTLIAISRHNDINTPTQWDHSIFCWCDCSCCCGRAGWKRSFHLFFHLIMNSRTGKCCRSSLLLQIWLDYATHSSAFKTSINKIQTTKIQNDMEMASNWDRTNGNETEVKPFVNAQLHRDRILNVFRLNFNIFFVIKLYFWRKGIRFVRIDCITSSEQCRSLG